MHRAECVYARVQPLGLFTELQAPDDQLCLPRGHTLVGAAVKKNQK